MVVIVNFAHPLSANVAAEIRAQVGEFKEDRVPAQFDLGLDLAGQVADLAIEANVQAADLVIPPSLSAAACLLSDHFEPNNRPKIVWLRRNDSTPPQFVLGGIE